MSTEQTDPAAATEETEATAAERTTLTRLAERGEVAMKRLVEELEKHERVTGARSRLEGVEKSVLNALNIASVAEVEQLRNDLAALEERLAKLEGGSTTRKKAEPSG
jgi:hypothetical protein